MSVEGEHTVLEGGGKILTLLPSKRSISDLTSPERKQDVNRTLFSWLIYF